MFYIHIIIYVLIFVFLIFALRNGLLKNKEGFEMTSITKHEKLQIYSFLEILSNCLTIRGIKFWIIAGTLLGSVRHGELIPWDDDADIGIFNDDLEKVIKLNTVLNKFGYEITPHWLIYKFKKIGQEYPFVDIFCYNKSGNKYIMNNDELIEKWSEEYYMEDELFPLISYKFGSLNLPGPKYPLSYLDRMYPKWRHLGIQSYDHKKKEHIHEEIHLNQENDKYKMIPYKTIKINKNKNLDLFKKKKYAKYHGKYIVIFE